ncbi:hypothetical protein ABBQ32_009889 [Trebouxia sp. C0010 RCD-2024]
MFASVLVYHDGSTSTASVRPDAHLSDFKQNLVKQTGVPAVQQVLLCCGRQLESGPVLPQIPAGCIVSLLSRLRGGSSTINITLQPRVQKDKWSMYWKESMATKTEAFESIALVADVNTKVSALQQHVAEQLGWTSLDKLQRLEGFRDPWEFAVCKGRAVNLDASLQENGIMTDAVIIVVRRVLIPDAWKV